MNLQDILAAQVERVDRRVLGSPAYAEDARFVRVAAAQVRSLVSRLGLGAILRNLTPPTAKPQFLLEFDHDPSPVVLKVYGKLRPTERAIQQLWWKTGVRCVKVLDGGDEPATWLVLESIPGPGPVDVATDPGATTQELAAMLVAAHDPTFAPDGAVTLTEGVSRHLASTVASLARHGYDPPPRWESWVGAYCEGRKVPLHGDLFPGNVVVDGRDGGLRMIDSCGYLGPPEFDAARWCARIGGAAGADMLARAWISVEPLDEGLLGRLLNLELLMEAGVRELVKEERSLPWTDRDPVTQALLDRLQSGHPTGA